MTSYAHCSARHDVEPSRSDRGRSLQVVFLTGATGLLAPHIISVLEGRTTLWTQGFRHRLQRPQFVVLDLTDRRAVEDTLDRVSPNIVVHLAALTNVDSCETHPSSAYAANVAATRILVDWMHRRRPHGTFVYVSTDQVYDGPGPHAEDDISPANFYGMSKLWGEDLARRLTRFLVLRTNFFAMACGPHHGGFAQWLVDSLRDKRSITLFDDVLFSPVHAEQVAELLWSLLDRRVHGTYNLGSADGLSKAAFAERVARRLGYSLENASVGSVSEVKLKAYRPNDMRMQVDRIAAALGRAMPSVDEGIDRLVKTMCSD